MGTVRFEGEFEGYEPRTDAELRAAAVAVVGVREREEALAVFAGLTLRERVLIERAYAAGVEDYGRAIEGLIGSAAVTLDAQKLRRIQRPHLNVVRKHPSVPPPDRAVNLVCGADRWIRREEEARADA